MGKEREFEMWEFCCRKKVSGGKGQRGDTKPTKPIEIGKLNYPQQGRVLPQTLLFAVSP